MDNTKDTDERQKYLRQLQMDAQAQGFPSYEEYRRYLDGEHGSEPRVYTAQELADIRASYGLLDSLNSDPAGQQAEVDWANQWSREYWEAVEAERARFWADSAGGGVRRKSEQE